MYERSSGVAVQKQEISAPGHAEDCVLSKSAKLPRGKGTRKERGKMKQQYSQREGDRRLLSLK